MTENKFEESGIDSKTNPVGLRGSISPSEKKVSRGSIIYKLDLISTVDEIDIEFHATGKGKLNAEDVPGILRRLANQIEENGIIYF